MRTRVIFCETLFVSVKGVIYAKHPRMIYACFYVWNTETNVDF